MTTEEYDAMAARLATLERLAAEVCDPAHWKMWPGSHGVGKIADGHGIAVCEAVAALREALSR